MLHMSEDKKKIPKVQYNRIIKKIKKGDNPQINVSYLFICLEPYITIFLTELYLLLSTKKQENYLGFSLF